MHNDAQYLAEEKPKQLIKVREMPLLGVLGFAGSLLMALIFVVVQYSTITIAMAEMKKQVEKIDIKMDSRDERIQILLQSNIKTDGILSTHERRLNAAESDIRELQKGQRWAPK